MAISGVTGAQSVIRPGVCTSSTRPASPYEGQGIYETDTDRILFWNNSAWVGTGKTDAISVNASGVLTATVQPRFLATRSGNLTGYTGGSSVVFNATTSNVGSHFNTSTGLFTAPVSGNYVFSASIYQSRAVRQIWFMLNGNRERSFVLSEGIESILAGSSYIYLTAGDTLGIASWSDGASGVTINQSFEHTFFRGALIS